MSDLAALCRACGMCCDGSLFGRVPLAPAEVEVARRHRLRVVASGAAMDQPCAAHGAGGCAVYAERPRACQAFACRLYERHAREGGPLGPRLEAVARARELLTLLGSSTDAEGLQAEPWFAELVERLEADFGRA